MSAKRALKKTKPLWARRCTRRSQVKSSKKWNNPIRLVRLRDLHDSFKREGRIDLCDLLDRACGYKRKFRPFSEAAKAIAIEWFGVADE